MAHVWSRRLSKACKLGAFATLHGRPVVACSNSDCELTSEFALCLNSLSSWSRAGCLTTMETALILPTCELEYIDHVASHMSHLQCWHIGCSRALIAVRVPSRRLLFCRSALISFYSASPSPGKDSDDEVGLH